MKLFSRAFTKDPIYYSVYLVLIFAAALLAFLLFKRGNRKLLFLVIVLTATFITEAVASVTENKVFSPLYHLYNPLEYACFCKFYIDNSVVKNLNKIVRWSIVFFIPLALYFSIKKDFTSLPANNLILESFLLFIIYTYLMFNLDINKNIPVYLHSNFWISVGVLLFFGGAFAFIGVYDTLKNMGLSNTRMGYGFIVKPVNIALYICIIAGLTCEMHHKPYSTQLS